MMKFWIFSAVLLVGSSARAGSPFTHAMRQLEFLAQHPEVWRTVRGPLLSVDVVASEQNSTTFQFKVRESIPQLQPRAMVGGHSLADPSFRPTPDAPEVVMVTTGHRQEIRYYRATVRRHRDPTLPGGPTIGPEFLLDRFEDVTDQMLCEQKLNPAFAAPR